MGAEAAPPRALALRPAGAAARAALAFGERPAAGRQQAPPVTTQPAEQRPPSPPPEQQQPEARGRRQRQKRRTAPPAACQAAPDSSVPNLWQPRFELAGEDTFLGGGAFAKVFRLVERPTGASFAMKVMSRPNFAMRGIGAQVDAEIDAMRVANHLGCRNVVRLEDVVEESDYVYMRLELCTCDLLRYASLQPEGRLSEEQARRYATQLMSGLADLHTLGIIHRDLKPENMLLSEDSSLRIADFGWCADVRDAPSSLAGTLQYMAPEMLEGSEAQTEAVDLWSAGITVWQLLTNRAFLTTYIGPGATELSHHDAQQSTNLRTQWLVEEIRAKCPLTEALRPDSAGAACFDLLRRLLQPEVRHRATAAEALSHIWLGKATRRSRGTAWCSSERFSSVPLSEEPVPREQSSEAARRDYAAMLRAPWEEEEEAAYANEDAENVAPAAPVMTKAACANDDAENIAPAVQVKTKANLVPEEDEDIISPIKVRAICKAVVAVKDSENIVPNAKQTSSSKGNFAASDKAERPRRRSLSGGRPLEEKPQAPPSRPPLEEQAAPELPTLLPRPPLSTLDPQQVKVRAPLAEKTPSAPASALQKSAPTSALQMVQVMGRRVEAALQTLQDTADRAMAEEAGGAQRRSPGGSPTPPAFLQGPVPGSKASSHGPPELLSPSVGTFPPSSRPTSPVLAAPPSNCSSRPISPVLAATPANFAVPGAATLPQWPDREEEASAAAPRRRRASTACPAEFGEARAQPRPSSLGEAFAQPRRPREAFVDTVAPGALAPGAARLSAALLESQARDGQATPQQSRRIASEVAAQEPSAPSGSSLSASAPVHRLVDVALHGEASAPTAVARGFASTLSSPAWAQRRSTLTHKEPVAAPGTPRAPSGPRCFRVAEPTVQSRAAPTGPEAVCHLEGLRPRTPGVPLAGAQMGAAPLTTGVTAAVAAAARASLSPAPAQRGLRQQLRVPAVATAANAQAATDIGASASATATALAVALSPRQQHLVLRPWPTSAPELPTLTAAPPAATIPAVGATAAAPALYATAGAIGRAAVSPTGAPLRVSLASALVPAQVPRQHQRPGAISPRFRVVRTCL